MKLEWNWKIGDTIDLIQELDSESVDMVFADPPFNVGIKYGGGVNDKRKDYLKWSEEWIRECYRVLKPTGSFYHMNITKNLPGLLPIMDKYGFLINLIIWRHACAWGSNKRFYNKYQPIMLYAKTENYKFNTHAQRTKPFKRWGKTNGKMQGQMGDLWDDISFVYAGSIHHKEAIIRPGTNSKVHPTQMPVDLVKRAILFSTDQEDLVLDPFLGSGSTLVACKQTDRSCIGFEINPENESMYADRTMKGVLPISSFFE